MMILTTQEEIREFLLHDRLMNGEKVFRCNAYITISGSYTWTYRPFHVYNGKDVDYSNLIDEEDMIKIVSVKNLQGKDGAVKYIKPYLDDENDRPHGHIDREKSVYKVKVSEIKEIKLEKYV